MTTTRENSRIRSSNIKNSFHFNSMNEVDLKAIYRILRRQKDVIIRTTLVITILAAIFAFMRTPLYKAESVIQINSQNQNVINIQDLILGVPTDEATIRSEIDILKSRNLAESTIDRLDLQEDSEFNPNKKVFFRTIFKFLFGGKSHITEYNKDIERAQKSETVDNFLARLSVTKNPRSYTVKIHFLSKSPKKAALIANTIIDEYILDQMEMRFKLTKQTNEWLNTRVDELRRQLRDSEEEVQHFREEYDLIDIDGKTIDDQQLIELNRQLALAKNDLAETEAKLHHSKELIKSGIDFESSIEVLDSPLIQRLKEQETQVLRKKSELSTRYGYKHPQMININAELNDLRNKINQEISNIIQSLENDVEITKVHKQNLIEDIELLKDKLDIINKNKIQLAELIRETESNRVLYEIFLTKFKETSQSEDYNYPAVRIVSEAQPPLYKSYPPKKIIIIIALIFGLGLGIAIALLLDYLDAGFRTPEQVEESLGLPVIGTIPELENESEMTNYVLAKPTSFFTDSLKATMTAVHFFNPDNPPKIIMLLSSIAKEGKSSYSLALARMQAKAGYKVLLLDCDLRRSNIAKLFGKPAEYGLKQLILGEITEKEAIKVDEDTGLHYIPSTPNTPNSQEILGSNKMMDLLQKLSEKYDFIFIDSSPLLPVFDSLGLAKMADAVVLIIKWGKTPRIAVVSALKRLVLAGIKVSGVVLSRVDFRKQTHYGYKCSYDYGEEQDRIFKIKIGNYCKKLFKKKYN